MSYLLPIQLSSAPLLAVAMAALAPNAAATIPPQHTAAAKTPVSSAQAANAARHVRDIEHRLDEAAKENQKGLESSRQFGVAYHDFLRAADYFARVTDATARLEHDNPAAPATELAAMLRRAHDGRVTALLNGASISLASANLHDAMGLVNQVLAIDPDNPEAMSMRERIEYCANQQLYVGPFTGQLPIVQRVAHHAPVRHPPIQTPRTWTASRGRR